MPLSNQEWYVAHTDGTIKPYIILVVKSEDKDPWKTQAQMSRM
jgi:hypothetical protein